MKKLFMVAAFTGSLFTGILFAQKSINVPQAVKSAFAQNFPAAKNVMWEKEKGNFEANWGGNSNEDSMAMFSPAGVFLEVGNAISVNELPSSVAKYVKKNYKNASITEALKLTDAKGKVTYEAEVNGKDVVFDEHGNFVNTEKEGGETEGEND